MNKRIKRKLIKKNHLDIRNSHDQFLNAFLYMTHGDAYLKFKSHKSNDYKQGKLLKRYLGEI